MSDAPGRVRITAITVFIALSVIHLIALLAEWDTVSLWTKPFLMPVLAIAAILTARPRFGRVGLLLTVALIFSTIGDVALLGDGNGPFIAGLSAFLVAHLVYIAAFARAAIRSRPQWWSLIFVAWFGVLMGVLVPHLDALLLPVIGYGVVIATMAIVATRCSPRVISGAILFLMSDSILAVNKFVETIELPEAGFLIMVTYIAGQALIAWGLQDRFTPSSGLVVQESAGRRA
ncbi:putative membrane protein YhhN [Okibacterium sp. HSC-33S16]|uniref:lysoplasmalogenase n=1 Tax=Okibacterium sp. HSC-33S16 TaxID=2910965 RepID=UPI0020A20DA6|nr:lysoplasmalogenase [Okibacterium sp. HSC-33S16]MCP2030811.1 putative membrane protein YhhN [Okibacterium sp. HSC-33S16]